MQCNAFEMKHIHMLIILPILTFFTVSTFILPAAAVTTMALGASSSYTASSVACCGSTSMNNIITRTGPTGHFWNVITGVGTSGGSGTEPMYYEIDVSDSSDTSFDFASCGNPVNYWAATSTIIWWCNDSGYAAGSLTCFYEVTNEDTLQRSYTFECIAYYE
jgi:hypothetical protein